MSYEDKVLLQTANGPLPQMWDQAADQLRPYPGDADGALVKDVKALAALNAIAEALEPLATEQKAEAIRALLATLAGKDFATQTTLAAVLAKLADLATTAKQDAAKAAVDAVKNMLQDGSAKMTVNGSKVAEQLTEADAVANVLTFAATIGAVEIYHEAGTRQDFIVNGVTLHVPPGYYRTPVDGVASAEVTIPAGVSCIVGRLV